MLSYLNDIGSVANAIKLSLGANQSQGLTQIIRKKLDTNREKCAAAFATFVAKAALEIEKLYPISISRRLPMSPDQIKAAFFAAVEATAANIDSFAAAPGKDFTRSRKLPPEKLIPFLVAEGSASTKNEMLDFFGLDPNGPTDSAFNQQRAKLHPDALKDVLDRFNASLEQVSPPPSYRYLAADGSTATFFSTPKYASPEYYVSEGHSARGFYSIHINALYDLDQNIYPDALLQPVHNKDEFSAFCELVDRRPVLPNTKDVFIGDRGYCSYNNMAHVTEKRQYFLFRTKDINSKGLVQGFSLPKTGSCHAHAKQLFQY